MSQPKKIFLDARELEHPLPLERAIGALRDMQANSYLYMVHRKNPIPLIDLASEQGFRVLSKEDNNNTWHILISKDTSANLEALCDV